MSTTGLETPSKFFSYIFIFYWLISTERLIYDNNDPTMTTTTTCHVTSTVPPPPTTTAMTQLERWPTTPTTHSYTITDNEPTENMTATPFNMQLRHNHHSRWWRQQPHLQELETQLCLGLLVYFPFLSMLFFSVLFFITNLFFTIDYVYV